MPLSTSNSNLSHKTDLSIGQHSWAMTWLIVIILCCGVLGSYELYLKHKGFVPSIESNNDLWSWHRANVKNNSLVILGASRSQLDINIPYLKQKLPDYNVTQLSVNGHYPMASFESLARDERFKGTLLVSFNAQALEPFYFDMQLPQNEYYANQSSFYKSIDAYLSAHVDSHLRIMHPLLSLQQIVDFYDKNKSFKSVFYTTAHVDQSVTANYSLTNTKLLYKHFVSEKKKNYLEAKPTKPQEWQQQINLLVEYTQSIENRGGRVILIRFPTFKGHWQLDEEFYPRSQYWDKIAANSFLKTLHFNDVKGIESFESPDSSHLDQKDTLKFTQILFDELIDLQYLNHD